jgi:hypothetical protein
MLLLMSSAWRQKLQPGQQLNNPKQEPWKQQYTRGSCWQAWLRRKKLLLLAGSGLQLLLREGRHAEQGTLLRRQPQEQEQQHVVGEMQVAACGGSPRIETATANPGQVAAAAAGRMQGKELC